MHIYSNYILGSDVYEVRSASIFRVNDFLRGCLIVSIIKMSYRGLWPVSVRESVVVTDTWF
jgi:hypothetical protein